MNFPYKVLQRRYLATRSYSHFELGSPVPSVTQHLYPTLEKFIAALRGSLRKVEPTSSSRNDCGTKKVARQKLSGYVTLAIFPATCIATKLPDKLQKSLPSVKAP